MERSSRRRTVRRFAAVCPSCLGASVRVPLGLYCNGCGLVLDAGPPAGFRAPAARTARA